MAKWARVEAERVQEVIDYNPYEVINEAFHHLFHPCGDEVEVGYEYDQKTKTYTEPLPIQPEQ